MKMNKKKLLTLTGAGCFVAAVSLFVFLLNAGSWLLVSDPLPERLDVVFTFGGENARVRYSKELMKKHLEAHWFLSDYKFGYTRLLRKDGYNMKRVSHTDTCSNTLSEVAVLDYWVRSGEAYRRSRGSEADSVQFIHQSGAASLQVGLVSSPYHMRRIQMMVDRTDLKGRVQFHFLPVPMNRYDYDRDMFRKWWKYKNVRRVVISELQKIVYFWLTN
ncbi:MAG: YdcF family protein [Chitinispirillaceae bacterium]